MPNTSKNSFKVFEIHISKTSSRNKYNIIAQSLQGGEDAVGSFFYSEDIRKMHLKLNRLIVSSYKQKKMVVEKYALGFGRDLFSLLFNDEVRDCYVKAKKNAGKNGLRLHLKFDDDAHEVANLPWEFLYNPENKDFLFVSKQFSIARSLVSNQSAPLIRVKLPLRILGVVTANKPSLGSLKVSRERKQIENALSEMQKKGQVYLHWLERPTWEKVQDELDNGGWHILHFIGHGRMDGNHGELAFNTTKGLTWINGQKIARVLERGDRFLRLVVLNACKTGTGNVDNPFSNVAATVIRHGVPAVVAMQHKITDESAINFSKYFYGGLVKSGSIDVAVSEGRHSLSVSHFGHSHFEWAIPVLYTRTRESKIFNITQNLEQGEETHEVVKKVKTKPVKVDYKVQLELLGPSAPLSFSSPVDWKIIVHNAEKITVRNLKLLWGSDEEEIEGGLDLKPDERREFARKQVYDVAGQQTEKVMLVGTGVRKDASAGVLILAAPSIKGVLMPEQKVIKQGRLTTWMLELKNDGGENLTDISVLRAGRVLKDFPLLAITQTEQFSFNERYVAVGSHIEEMLITAKNDAGVIHTWNVKGSIQVTRDISKWGDLEFVMIPQGNFLMGSKKDILENSNPETLPFDDEMPQHEVEIPYDYWMARYPVTNKQFSDFIMDTNYVTTAEKTGAGQVFEDGQWQNISAATWRQPLGKSGGIAGKKDHPVVLVSWWDALEYCDWLNDLYRHRLPDGFVFRLCSEAEWEKASRGSEGCIYPWGREPELTRMNAGLSFDGTTKVDKYALSGDSPYGVADTAGNVWEWTLSLFKEYPYNAADGREDMKSLEPRVLRGGSFINPVRNARCACRTQSLPDACLSYYGFRVVVAPPDFVKGI